MVVGVLAIVTLGFAVQAGTLKEGSSGSIGQSLRVQKSNSVEDTSRNLQYTAEYVQPAHGTKVPKYDFEST
jgi:hypothetical protein